MLWVSRMEIHQKLLLPLPKVYRSTWGSIILPIPDMVISMAKSYECISRTPHHGWCCCQSSPAQFSSSVESIWKKPLKIMLLDQGSLLLVFRQLCDLLTWGIVGKSYIKWPLSKLKEHFNAYPSIQSSGKPLIDIPGGGYGQAYMYSNFPHARHPMREDEIPGRGDGATNLVRAQVFHHARFFPLPCQKLKYFGEEVEPQT